MRLLVYSAKEFEIPYLEEANRQRHEVSYIADPLNTDSAIKSAGYEVVSIFSGDDASTLVLEILWDLGVRYITLRSAGYNNINLKTAKRLGFKVANVADYSPHAIAEHAVALILAFNRKIIQASEQVKKYNFLLDNLIGFNLHGKTVGVIGTGRIGSVMVKILHGFGCRILACDLTPDQDLVELCNVTYTNLDGLCKESDIISLHIPSNSDNLQLINRHKLALMKSSAIIVNTARGNIVDTNAMIEALQAGKIAGYCTDVYEKERGTFFKRHSRENIKDKKLKELLSLPNVLLTPHQAFVTVEALNNIAEITFENINSWASGTICPNELGLNLVSS